MRRVFITGGTGFFGKSMLDCRRRSAAMQEDEWTVLSRDPDSFRARNPQFAALPGVSFVRGDVRDFTADGAFDDVIHAATAAVTTLPDDEMTSTIVDGTRHVIDFARRCGATRILFTSSGAVYGPQVAPVTETSECRPVTAYGRGKLEAERLLAESGLDVRIARCFAFTGPFLSRDIHYAIGNFIGDCLAGRDIVIRGDGTPRRSYLYADDLVEWLFAILEKGETARPYNVGSARSVSIRELAETVRMTLGGAREVRVLAEAKPGPASVYVPDVSRICSELGVRENVGLEDAIRRSAANPYAV
ncbi:MAG: NAD(P)-dependent oxidoreductase [Kiritimatiellae bacterium]|nr:NAD(P)-dependent oxidoreductase [Kiritimatiellia bacterium]